MPPPTSPQATPTTVARSNLLASHARTARSWPTVVAIAIGLSLGAAGCEGDAPQAEVLRAIPTRDVTTRDGRLTAPFPSDLFVTPFDRSIFGTSADGSFRLFVERRPEQALPAVLGGLKDELIGLGWEPSEEKHYAAAVSIDMARGPKQARQLRSTWVIELGPDVLVCEAIANAISPTAAVSSTSGDAAPLPSATAIHDLQSARLGQPLRTLCESLRVGQ